MEYETIRYTTAEGIGRITLCRPEAMNAITPAMLNEIRAAILKSGEDEEVKVIVLTGEGKAFSAGVDLKWLKGHAFEGGKVGDALDDPARKLIETIRSVPKVVIALVNGFCLTGAMEIVLACDLIISSEDAKFGDTHAKWGLRPTWGMSARLPLRVGFLKAKEVSFTADLITAKEAEQMGMVNRSVPADQIEKTLQTMAKQIMSNSPQSVTAYKRLYNTIEDLAVEKGLEAERLAFFDIGDTAERLAPFLKEAEDKKEQAGQFKK
jgi:enoyl-CoA hydratase/carnithine racemase